MPTNKKNESGMMDSMINHSRKVMIFVIALAILSSATVIAAVLYMGGGDAVAAYGDKKVLKSDYADFKSKCEGFYNYNSDSKTKKECSQNELEDLILRKALETEAEKRGVTVTESEINKKYDSLAKPYGSETAYLRTIKSSFGYTKEYVRSNIKRDLLKEKLAPSLLKKINVTGVILRYDWSGDIKEYDKNAEESKAKLEKEFYSALKNGLGSEEIGKMINEVAARDGRPWNVEPVMAITSQENLNEKSAKDTFAGDEDWKNISELKNKGDVTEIFKSSGGYVAVYRLESITTGQFSDWNEYKQDVLKKAKKYSFEYKYKKFKKSAVAALDNTIKRAEKIAGIQDTKAAVPPPPIDCSGQHFSRMNGVVVDASNTAHGVVASVSIAPGSIGTWPACKNPQEGGAVTVNSNYMHWGGAAHHDPGLLQLGWQNDASRKYLSCWVRWNISISAKGFHSISYGNRSVTANGITTNLDKPLGTGGKVGETYAGFYQAENAGNNNAYIYLAPLAPKGWHDEADKYDWEKIYEQSALNLAGFDADSDEKKSCQMTVGWTCDMRNTDYRSAIHIYDGTQAAPNWGKPISNDNSVVAKYRRHGYGFENACGGNLNHGFVFEIPQSLKDGHDHWLWAYAFDVNGSAYQLGGSPQKVKCTEGDPPDDPEDDKKCSLETVPATLTQVNQGSPVKLSWMVKDAQAPVSLKQDSGPSILLSNTGSASGVKDLLPLVTTKYTLIDRNGNVIKDKGADCSINVTVVPGMSGGGNQVAP